MEKINTEIQKALESKILVKIIIGIGMAIVALLIFSAGVTVGFHKASFGRDWGEHYNENFGFGMRGGPMMGYFPNAHGATGEIIKTELPNIIVEGHNNIEKSILISPDTKIEKGSTAILATDLQTSDFVVVIGTPDSQGIIEAKLIRVLLNPELLK